MKNKQLLIAYSSVPYYIMFAESGSGRLGLNIRKATPLTSAVQIYGSIATSVNV